MDKNTTRKPMNVLMAYDGSEHAQAAISLLCDLCVTEKDRKRSSVKLLTVIMPRQTADHEHLQAALDSAENYLGDKCFQVTSELILGYPAEKIMEFAEKAKANLIIVGAKGLRATLRILLGGVAQQVVEYASCPVLVVRAPYEGIRRVLLVSDGSSHSDRALDFLANFPLPAKAEVRVMHVLPPVPVKPKLEAIGQTWPLGPEVFPATIPVSSEEASAWQAEEEKQGKTILEESLKKLKALGIDSASVLQRGDAATEILQYIDDEEIDLVIAGSRGLSQVQGWLLGSVSRKLVHYAGCSLLIVKESPEE